MRDATRRARRCWATCPWSRSAAPSASTPWCSRSAALSPPRQQVARAVRQHEGPHGAGRPAGSAVPTGTRGSAAAKGGHAPLLNAAPSRRARQVALRGAGPAALAPSRRARQVALRGAGPAASAAAMLPSTPLGEAAPPSGTPLGDNSTRPHRRPASRHGPQPPRASGDVARRRARCFRRRAALGRAARRRFDESQLADATGGVHREGA